MSRNSSSAIQVVVRLRPMNEKEAKHGTVPVVTASTSDRTVNVIRGQGNRTVKSSYSFDNVFTAFSTQEEVFEETLKPVIGDVMKGFESTVFAYGQTGTGKTHTMEGDIAVEENQGVIPRAARLIFESLKQPQYSNHKVYCSYLEIYNEDLCDLLVKRSKESQVTKLEIMESKEGPFCRGLSERPVSSAKDVLNLMQEAQQNRRVGETKMNKHSSRSHCIFTLRVNAKATVVEGNGAMGKIDFTGKLHMVDLAGSECAKTASMDRPTGEDSARERERMNINRSLLTLGRVIQMLKERGESGKRVRIPYRDSKLTRILQESLGGRCKTVIIATLSPSVTAVEESISTLNYAQSANGIMNKPVSSSYMAVGGMPVLSTANSSGEAGNDGSGLSVEHWQEMECRLEYMKAQVEEAQGALARKHLQQQELVERAERAESGKREIEQNLHNANQQIMTVKKTLKEEEKRRKEVADELRKVQYLFERTGAILRATQDTENLLSAEARSLLDTLQFTISESETFYDCLVKQQKTEFEQKTATKNLYITSTEILEKGLLRLFSNLESKFKTHRVGFDSVSTEIASHQEKFTHEVTTLLSETTSTISCIVKSLKEVIDQSTVALESSNDNINDSIKSISDLNKKSHEELDISCSGLRETLQQIVQQIKKLTKEHTKLSRSMMKNMEDNINSAKDQVSSITQSTCDAINKAQERRSNLLKEQSCVFSELETVLINQTSALSEKASTAKVVLDDTRSSFKEGWKHHEDMLNALADQKGLVIENGKHNRTLIQTQTSKIQGCQDFLQTSEQLQNQIRNDFMKNIMSGIQSLIASQLENIEGATKQHFVQANDFTKEILEENQSIETSCCNLLDKVDQTNENLNQSVRLAASNDDRVDKAMDLSSKDVLEVKEKLDAISYDAEKLTSSGQILIKQLQEVDRVSSNEVVTSMNALCNQHSTELSERILSNANQDLAKVSKHIEFVSKDSSSLLSDSSSQIDLLNTSQTDTFHAMREDTERIVETISGFQGIFKANVDNQHSLFDKVSDCVLSSHSTFANGLSSENQNCLNVLLENLNSTFLLMENDTHDHVSEGVQSSKTLEEKLTKHSFDVIRCDEKIFSLPIKTKLSFATILSKTPSEHKVLEKSGIPVAYNPLLEDDEVSDDHIETVIDKENACLEGDRRLSTESSNSSDNVSIVSAGDMATFNKRTLKQISGNSPIRKKTSPSKRSFQLGMKGNTPSKSDRVLPKKIRRADPSPAKQKLAKRKQRKESRLGQA